MHNSPAGMGGPGGPMTLVNLETMSCGCVAALYRARPMLVEIELVEAKGPHCRYYRHQAGEMIGLGVSDPLDGPGTEPQV